MRIFRVMFLIGVVGLAFPLTAATGEPATTSEKTEVETPVPEPRVFVTSHTGNFGGETIAYTATAGDTFLLDEEGRPKAAIFAFAYTKNGVEDAARRPVTFVWNGGPGSSSVWLHMGAMGPRRVVVPSNATDPGPPPYEVDDNPLALLDVTDLVFVDPVGTGFSRALGTHENKEFWGLNEDAESVADFIRIWITRNRRWMSPKYLLGESFGTTRAGAVTSILEGRGNVSLNGLILVSQALDYTGSTPSHDNLIAFITYLPTMAATAWYHGKITDPPESFEDFLDEARRFATDEYAPALLAGSGLDPARREHIQRRLAYFTGLSEDYIELSDLRILADRFRKELLRSEGMAVGRLDSRYTGNEVDKLAERPDGDPAGYKIDGAYAAGLSSYMAADLKIDMDRDYKFSGGRELGGNWKWRTVSEGKFWEPTYVNVARELSRAMRRNDGLRVMIASGYYDFATPFFDAEYTFARHGFLPDRLHFDLLRGGTHDVPPPAVTRQADGRHPEFHERGNPMSRGRVWIVTLLLLLAFALPALAADETDEERAIRAARDDTWDFFVGPYGWLTGVEGTVVTDGDEVDINIPFEDFLDHVSSGLMVYFEARRNKMFVAFDGTWAVLNNEIDGRLFDLDIEIRQQIYDIRVGYEVHNKELGDVIHRKKFDWQRRGLVDLYIGGRYFKTEPIITITPIIGDPREISQADSRVDPFVGLRLGWDMSYRWSLGFRGDVGGFGIGRRRSVLLAGRRHARLPGVAESLGRPGLPRACLRHCHR